jgi:hypothetical protein
MTVRPMLNPRAFARTKPLGAHMSRISSRTKKIAIASIAVALVVGGGGAAFAYWTANGTGTGSATTGTSTALIVTSSAPTGPALSPGGASQSVEFTVGNPAGGSQTLSAVEVTVAAADGTPWTATPGCSAADYTLGTPVIDYGPIDGGGEVTGTVSITMNDLGTNQDACKGVTVPLYFTAS